MRIDGEAKAIGEVAVTGARLDEERGRREGERRREYEQRRVTV